MLLLDQPQFRIPVHEREAQLVEVRVAGPDLRLDFRDLPAATFDSCRYRHPFGFDLGESPAIALEAGLLAAQALPA
jgi:hypothetical protein